MAPCFCIRFTRRPTSIYWAVWYPGTAKWQYGTNWYFSTVCWWWSTTPYSDTNQHLCWSVFGSKSTQNSSTLQGLPMAAHRCCWNETVHWIDTVDGTGAKAIIVIILVYWCHISYTSIFQGDEVQQISTTAAFSAFHRQFTTSSSCSTEPRPAIQNTATSYDHFFEKFQTNYDVQQDVSVDESLLLWKGRLIFRQYLPLKRARFGIKIYKLCESATGYTYRYYVYVGKDDSFTLPCAPGVPVMPSDFGSTEKIVWYLMMPLLDKGHRLYVDNFYTSVQLFHMLFLHKTPACGTIRSNRKDYPKQLVQKKLTPGESSAMRSQELLAVKFTDKKDVYMLSTIHDAACTTVSVRRRNVQTMDKPNCILQYSANMGGVDKCDQLIEPYDVTRKCMIRYKKLSIHLIHLATSLQTAVDVCRFVISPSQSSQVFCLRISKLSLWQQILQMKTWCDSLNDIFQRKLLQLDQRQTHRSAVRFVTAKKLDMKADICVAAAPASMDCVLMSASKYIIPKESTGSNWHQTWCTVIEVLLSYNTCYDATCSACIVFTVSTAFLDDITTLAFYDSAHAMWCM